MRSLASAILLLSLVVLAGCEAETRCEMASSLVVLAGCQSETRCEKASRLAVDAECTPSLGGDYVINLACAGENASRCGGSDMIGKAAALSNIDLSGIFDACEWGDDFEPNPAASDCHSCIEKHCAQTRGECIEDLMGTWYGTLVYQCESNS
jgi:hypothetical protein